MCLTGDVTSVTVNLSARNLNKSSTNLQNCADFFVVVVLSEAAGLCWVSTKSWIVIHTILVLRPFLVVGVCLLSEFSYHLITIGKLSVQNPHNGMGQIKLILNYTKFEL